MQMELHVRFGHFEVYADGEFRTEFRDANFDKIEILGFVMEGINIANEWEGSAWVDSFTISEPTLAVAVSPKAKLATNLGETQNRKMTALFNLPMKTTLSSVRGCSSAAAIEN